MDRITAPTGYSPLVERALILAATAHRMQLRKGTPIPYIAHVVQVGMILLRHGFEDDLVVAGLLHDVVEDCDIPLDQIEAAFGAEVARLVAAVSEQKHADGQERPWEQRKTENLLHMRTGGQRVAALKAADAIHNAWSTTEALNEHGTLVWERFKRGPGPTLWYYRAILDVVRDVLGPHAITEELAAAIAALTRASEQIVLSTGHTET